VAKTAIVKLADSRAVLQKHDHNYKGCLSWKPTVANMLIMKFGWKPGFC